MSFTLEPHQLNAVDKGVPILRRNRILYLIFWMRKGKTLTSLSICNVCLKDVANAHVLFVSELEPLPSIKSDYALLDNPYFDFTAINYESLHKVEKKKYNIIIVDEAHRCGSYPKPNQATQKLKELAANTAIIYLSATPTPEQYSQWYHQLWISTYTPFAKWTNFYYWAKEFVDIVTTERHGLPTNDYDKADIKKIWSYVSKFCITVGEKQGSQTNAIDEKILTVQMSPKTVKIYNSLKRHKIYINEKGQAAIINSGAERDNKIAQVCSGTLKFDETVQRVIDGDGEIIDTSKAQFIRSYFMGRKIAILYRFVAEGKLLRMFFPDHTDDFVKFNASDSLTYINQVRSARVGISLATAYAIVMYNIEWSLLSYLQGMARGQNMYRTDPIIVAWIFSHFGDELKMYDEVSKEKVKTTDFYYAEQ